MHQNFKIIYLYMRHIQKIVVATLLSTTLTSCFKEEPLNAECDIEQAYIHLDNPLEMFFQKSDTLISLTSIQNDIIFKVKRGTDRSALAPQFRLTEGATIYPESGSRQDFSNGPIIYTVTSQDKEWSRKYNVSFTLPTVVLNTINYDFSTFEKNTNNPANKYYVWYDKSDEGTKTFSWATGNPGYYLSKTLAKSKDYPSVPVESELEEGKYCVKLTTRATGSKAVRLQMPIAAGNFFYGRFNANIALEHPMEATEFGWQINFKPVSFEGNYKYLRGEKVTDKDQNELTDKKDYGSIYAVLYDNEAGNKVLNGNDILTSENIVALAKLPDIDNTPEWTNFNIEFQYSKDIDENKMKSYGYSLAIVCSSSVNGDKFEGAVGSTLWIDKFTIKCEKIDE